MLHGVTLLSDRRDKWAEGCRIYNSASYSSLTHIDSTSIFLSMGSIAGSVARCTIENCVCASTFSSNSKSKKWAGAISGTLEASNVVRAFWSDEDRENEPLNAFMWEDDTTIVDNPSSSPVKLKEDVVTTLNTNKVETTDTWKARAKNDWVMLHMNGGSVGSATCASILTLRKFAPAPYKSHSTFAGWYTDSSLTIPWNPKNTKQDVKQAYAKYTPGFLEALVCKQQQQQKVRPSFASLFPFTELDKSERSSPSDGWVEVQADGLGWEMTKAAAGAWATSLVKKKTLNFMANFLPAPVMLPVKLIVGFAL